MATRSLRHVREAPKIPAGMGAIKHSAAAAADR
jgi:hypothetical protein